MKMGSAARRWVAVLGGTAVAALAFATAMHAHLRTACFEQDTPYLPICPDAPTRAEDILSELRGRIARNPGDSRAWARLLLIEHLPHSGEVLQAASALAPNDPNVARRRAVSELQAGKLGEGVQILIDLVRYRASAAAAKALAAIAVTPQGLAVLRPHLAESEWLQPALAYAVEMSPSAVLPLLTEALNRGVLTDETRRSYMRALKSRGLWLDAWGLWLAEHKGPVPLLYNSSFDQAIEEDGFDWEFAAVPRSRAGVLVDQETVAQRGMVLAMEFTGRAFTAPIVRQYVFTGPGTYKIHGEYMASKFHSESGLSWAVECPSGARKVLGRSAALQDTGGVWKPLEIEFVMPPECGPVASLQLQPAAAYEAETGMRGTVAFDNFSLAHTFDAP